MVLPGHPDKFCDQVADAIVAACAEADAEAYCQVEVGVWCDEVWISGGYSVGEAVIPPLEEIVQSVVRKVGYRDHRTGEVQRFRVLDQTCKEPTDPRSWTRKVNDQSICVGWAGYDLLTRYHTPEHFLAHTFREALWAAIQGGVLQGQGPDGKLLVQIAEEGAEWRLEQVLVTLQQSHDIEFLAFAQQVERVLREAYEVARRRDPRWVARWDEATFTLNPNGPLLDAGPFGDNGQTGRKLAMDFYGPRIGIGGGALSGKHLTHIDRIGSYGAREAAVRAVQSGARECRVLVAYAPNCPEPLEVSFEMEGPGRPVARSFFNHETLRRRYENVRIAPEWAQGGHFWLEGAPWSPVRAPEPATNTQDELHG
jgi:S-adenosylmethionine synthetase